MVEDRPVLTDATVRATPGLELGAKTRLVVIEDSMYQKDTNDGYWYRLSNERDIAPATG